MIKPLRARHRTTVVILAAVVPILFLLGLRARQPIPVAKAVTTLANAEPQGFVEYSHSDDAWPGLAIRTTWLVSEADDSRLAVTLEPLRDPRQPDLLVYWVDSAGRPDRLPDDAELLGRLGGRRSGSWILPRGLDSSNGRLVLYTLAKRRIVAMAAAPALGEVAP